MVSHAADRAAQGRVENAAEASRGPWMWGIVAVGAVLRLIALGHKSFWIDEIASVAIARRAAPAFWHFLWHDEGNMAAYYVLLRPWLHFGYAEGVVRLLSVIPGILSIPAMYGLGRRLFGRHTGVLAAALLALNPCAIAVSQEARAYSFLVLATLLSTYLFVRLMEEPGYGLACGYAIVAGLTCYFHYFGALVPAAHAISLAVPGSRRPWKALLPAAVIIAIMASPVLWLIHAQDLGHISWVQPPSLLEFYHLGVFLAANGGKAVGAVLLLLDLVLIGLFLGKVRTVWGEAGDGLQRWRYGLPVSLVLSPIVITLLVSIVRPAFYHRFLIICLPGFVLMTAVGVQRIRGVAWRKGALAAVCILSAVSTVIVYRRDTEDWRGAVRYLIAHVRPDDRVLYYQSIGEFAGESYRDWLATGEARPAPIAVDVTQDGWKNEVDGAPRVWLVLFRAKGDDAGSRLVEQDLMKRYQPGEVRFFPGVSVIEYIPRR